jgi:hypothetical protein
LTISADDGIVVVGGTPSALITCGPRAGNMRARGEWRWEMAPQSIETRVEGLEQRVTRLEGLPVRMDRLESQIVQLRTEMHDEFSAVRTEIRSIDKDVRDGFSAVRVEIRAGDEETRHYMRMLFEDYIDRLKRLDEGNNRDT